MANFYYQSEHLGRVIYLADIERLSSSQINTLKLELEDAISDIKSQMYQQRDTAEFDKIHSMSLKIDICQKFLSRVKRTQAESSGSNSVASSYHLSYFRQAVSTLIGPLQADQLYEKAKQDALRQLAKESNS
jgi:prephenate dehydratase|tara:strand:+ start:1490 stop:1885 length:396 start_codon:yes stop_codon:yes gene_type:complete